VSVAEWVFEDLDAACVGLRGKEGVGILRVELGIAWARSAGAAVILGGIGLVVVVGGIGLLFSLGGGIGGQHACGGYCCGAGF
jgi:hypothetical protein